MIPSHADNGVLELKLTIPDGLDPIKDRLSNRASELGLLARLRISTQLVDACAEAHRVGLYQGGFHASTILVSVANEKSDASIHIDFTATDCTDEDRNTDHSIEGDLNGLRDLLAWLLDDISDTELPGEVSKYLRGRQRAILKQWLHKSDDQPAPSLGQWKSVFAPFAIEVENDASVDTTGVIQAPFMPIGTGSTSRWTKDAAGGIRVTEVPQQLGRFQIQELIGEGGMGSVYRAIDLSNNETIAIKVLRNAGKDVAHAIRRFRKEARLLGNVQNDHITQFIDVGEDAGLHYFAMEFVDGIDLKTWLEERPGLTESEALQIAADLSRALVDAHSQEVIHRDIKPENILLKRRPEVTSQPSDVTLVQRPFSDFTLKLTDFGIARHVHQSQSMEVTQAGSVLGTPKYMSPEQCKSSDELDPTTDVYSIGITLFELLTGSVPYQADEFMKLAAMHCFDPIPSVQKRNATISESANRIVQRALAKDPTQRYGDASQLLTDLQRLLRGDPADVQAHPRLPADHTEKKLWEKTASWQLESDAPSLWPLVSNTERLNEAIGLPAVDYRTEKDPKLGLRKFGSFSLSGVKVSWEEHPFEWIEGQRMGILREFDSGPFKWFMSVVTLEPHPNGRTRLSHQIKIEPRNFLGRVLTTVEADWKGFRNLDKVYRRMDRSLRGKLTTKQGSDAFTDTPKMTRSQLLRLNQRLNQLKEAGVRPEVANCLGQVVREWSPQELGSLRPLVIADRLKIPSSEMIDACLLAADAGILNLHWDVLCPTCRVSANNTQQLAEIESHTHCEACDMDFQSNLAGAIEMVFQTHPEIRQVNTGQYCIGGPEHSPHVVVQLRIEAGECLQLPIDLPPGDYLLRGPRIPNTQSLRVQSTSAPSTWDGELSRLGTSHYIPKLRAGRQVLTLHNDLETLQVIRIERMIPRGDVVTAAAAAANPMFRKLFPHQQFAGNNPILTETMTFLATSINNIDELYTSLGDSEAYSAVHGHHAILERCVAGSGGTLVKTIGEKSLASFATRENAIIAAERIRAEWMESKLAEVWLGIGVHSGPTLMTTQNNQLDYFGSTVRAVTMLPELAGNATLLTEPIYADRSLAGCLPTLNDEIESVDLPGSPETRIKRLAFPLAGSLS
ncbi:Serine/threonine protein kinase PrkC, regulator of stationary phase [Rhodopirellula islandica]|uniref:Serine/threonine protein kinase PrkC, regulator of stationary phase n=1 Tax=Rhodopirellula islandica TaxID=595434 RepID=A0A0J1BCE6_RHOIS|nr:Serine/threonine protein kinase PrkC, regulator of stationary phase [Rhodopirellula islandica]